MNTAVIPVSIPALIQSALLNRDGLETMKRTLEEMHLSSSQRKSLRSKIEVREMEGEVFNFQRMFANPMAWRKNGKGDTWNFHDKEVEGLPHDFEVPTIGFASVLDERSTYLCRSNEYRHSGGRPYFETGRPAKFDAYVELTANVPFIPKKLMPKWGTRGQHYIMFDVPKWVGRSVIDDPYIVRQVSNYEFKVVSHWNLSDNEKQLMAFATR